MRRPLRLITACVLLSCLVAACGGDPAAPPPPPAPPPAPPPPPPAPVIGDTLLMGSGTAAALSAIITKRGTAVPAADVVDGFIRTRLSAVVRPTATVAEVNAALLAAGARIEGTQAGRPFMTLRIPAVASAEAAQAVGAGLVASGAFWIAIPTFEQAPAEVRFLPASGDSGISHLIPGRLPPAWNVQGLASSPIRVLLPDHYHQLTPIAPISRLLFTASPAGVPTARGNHGFHVAGILAANHDATPFTGAFPASAQLTVEGIPVGGLSSQDGNFEVVAKFPAAGRFLLSTSLGLRFDNSAADRFTLVVQALNWRIAAAPHLGRFLHLTSAGNKGLRPNPINQAFWNSEWAVAANQDDLRLLVRGVGLAAADSAGFDQYWAWMLANEPGAATRSPNVIMVGSSSRTGQESDFSSRGADLRTVGEVVFAPCVIRDATYPADPDDCNGTSARYSGTSMATPLIAGIAAYLWSIDPLLTPQTLKANLQEAYARSGVPGVLDAYWAVLRLDAGLGNTPLRRELLDVASGPNTPGRDGRFDEHDVGLFTQAFTAYHGQRQAAGTPNATDHSRFDLNGDGLTGDTTRLETFDLNADGQIGTLQRTVEGATQGFNELLLSDLRILCYYAYSALYQGSPQARSDALPLCVPPPVGVVLVDVSFPAVVPREVNQRLVVRVTGSQGQPIAGAAISVRATGGTAGSGSTGADGRFESDARLDASSPSLQLEIEVRIDGTLVDTRTLVALPESPVAVLSSVTDSEAPLYPIATYRSMFISPEFRLGFPFQPGTHSWTGPPPFNRSISWILDSGLPQSAATIHRLRVEAYGGTSGSGVTVRLELRTQDTMPVIMDLTLVKAHRLQMFEWQSEAWPDARLMAGMQCSQEPPFDCTDLGNPGRFTLRPGYNYRLYIEARRETMNMDLVFSAPPP